jgi:hypothetical protein
MAGKVRGKQAARDLFIIAFQRVEPIERRWCVVALRRSTRHLMICLLVLSTPTNEDLTEEEHVEGSRTDVAGGDGSE